MCLRRPMLPARSESSSGLEVNDHDGNISRGRSGMTLVFAQPAFHTAPGRLPESANRTHWIPHFPVTLTEAKCCTPALVATSGTAPANETHLPSLGMAGHGWARLGSAWQSVKLHPDRLPALALCQQERRQLEPAHPWLSGNLGSKR